MFLDGPVLPWRLSPLQALRRWPVLAGNRRVMMLHSGRPHEQWSRWSILAEPRTTFRYTAGDGDSRSELIGECPSVALAHRPLTDLRAVTAALRGIWLGMISYDIRLWVEPVLRRTPLAPDDRQWPIVEFAHCPGYLVHDTLTDRWHAGGTWRDGGYPPLDTLPVCDEPMTIGPPVPDWPAARFRDAVQRVREYIAAGDVFQVNLAQRFTAAVDGPHPQTSRRIFERLATVSPAWYGAYLELADRRVLMSTSPELFLDVSSTGHVTTRPIKGTRPISVPSDELWHSIKDQAELNMIVDLLRNDLGRVCSYGSVRVTDPRTIETHPTVHHGVATITGQLHPSRDLFDLLRATLPGGSITGAPKVRAMQIIDELECARRGPYCGAIGLIDSASGAACFNIAIRTMLHDAARGRLDLWAGGGIVADSDPTAEYDETLDKAAAMFAALQ